MSLTYSRLSTRLDSLDPTFMHIGWYRSTLFCLRVHWSKIAYADIIPHGQFPSNYRFWISQTHQVCLPHLLRSLKFCSFEIFTDLRYAFKSHADVKKVSSSHVACQISFQLLLDKIVIIQGYLVFFLGWGYRGHYLIARLPWVSRLVYRVNLSLISFSYWTSDQAAPRTALSSGS